MAALVDPVEGLPSVSIPVVVPVVPVVPVPVVPVLAVVPVELEVEDGLIIKVPEQSGFTV